MTTTLSMSLRYYGDDDCVVRCRCLGGEYRDNVCNNIRLAKSVYPNIAILHLCTYTHLHAHSRKHCVFTFFNSYASRASHSINSLYVSWKYQAYPLLRSIMILY